MDDPERLLENAFRAAVAAAHPEGCVPPHLPPAPRGRLLVVGAGKAAAAMARVVERHYRDLPDERFEGVVVTRYGHAVPTERITVLEAGHPVPDESGVRATERIVALARSAEAGDLVLVLVSGGGSALLTAPDGVTASEKAVLTQELLASGADIHAINLVRRHLSSVKGGALAVAAHPAAVLTLAISDVVGDAPAVIASGPTVASGGTFQDALDVLDHFGIEAPAARRALTAGRDGKRPRPPTPDDPRLDGARYLLVAEAQTSLEAAAEALREGGIPAFVLASEVTGEAREVGGLHAAIARQVARFGQPFAPPCAFLSGGETTVTVRGNGRGGRNAEFALGVVGGLIGPAAGRMPEGMRFWVLAADTDGIDGSEDNAGALLGPRQIASLEADAVRHALADNDAYGLLEEVGGLLVTGPTRTNVNDLRIVLVAPAVALPGRR
ncbi:MAG: glycerate kinase [Trueperaceae bacterium]